MHVDEQEAPWKVVRAFAGERGSALVHLHNVSGGVLSGDQLTLNIDVGRSSVVQVTTTGATRLYRHCAGSPDSWQQTTIHVAEGALLEYLPDLLIPFAGSRHFQRTSIVLDPGAALFAWDILAPGRQASGEMFAFESLRIKTELRSASRPLLLENLVLEPALRPLTSLGRMGPYTHLANFYACSVGVPAAKWKDLARTLDDFCGTHSRPGVMIWGSSALVADGVVVRGLGVSARELPATLAAVWKIAKRFLTGEDAVLPRKVY